MTNASIILANTLQSVCEDKTPLPIALISAKKDLPPQELAWLKHNAFQSVRHLGELKYIVGLFLQKPLKSKAQIVLYLLIGAVCQIRLNNTPGHLVTNTTVNAAKKLKFPWAKGLVNAVLRNYIAKEDEIIIPKNKLDIFYSHPQWLINEYKKSWPRHFEEILQANNQLPPFSIRVNTSKMPVATFKEQLTKNNIVFIQHEHIKECLFIKGSYQVESLPGFNMGVFYVQDPATMLSPYLLDLKDGLTILDACAAPGGKTIHIAQSGYNIDLTANEIEIKRIKTLTENISRMGCDNIKILNQDASEELSKQSFDRILLDAPCSATGIIRRQPDIKLIKTKDDIKYLTKIQKSLLSNLWQHLKPSGKLLYATCSVMPEENIEQIKIFTQKTSNAKVIDLEHVLPYALNTQYGMQILPGTCNMDGFFYCLLEKT